MGAPRKRPARDLPVRYLWLYTLAWAPYLVLYGVVLGASMELPLSWAAMAAMANGLPPAILGWWVLRLGRAAPGITDGIRFWGFHASAAAAYAIACVFGTWLLFRIFERLDSGVWNWSLESVVGPILWQLLICTLIYAVLAGLGHAVALRSLLGDRARLEIDTEPGEGFTARVRLPAMRAATGEASAS